MTRGAIYWHFKNKSDVFAAMCDRVHLPIETLCEPEHIERQEDPLGGVRDICVFVMRQTVRNAQWRRVYEIIFHKCEMVQENGAIFERQRQSHEDGNIKIRDHLRLARERGQLPAELDLDAATNCSTPRCTACWRTGCCPESFGLTPAPSAWPTASSICCACRPRCAGATCRAPPTRSATNRRHRATAAARRHSPEPAPARAGLSGQRRAPTRQGLLAHRIPAASSQGPGRSA